MQVATDKVVAFDYTLTAADGEVLDSSEGGEPLSYLHGQSGIIPGLEQALEGLSVGDQINVTVEPEEAYGMRDDELLQEVPREQFEGIDDIEIGMQFQAETPEGVIVFTVINVSESMIQVDGNHPLAGMSLTFDVTIRSVRDATPSELEHGHAHGDDGDC